MSKKQTYGERIIALVDQMKVNGEDMRIWANIPLAKEALKLIRTIPEEEQETDLGKAYALNAVMEKLSEYDTPRLALEILRQELEYLRASEEKSDWLTEEDILADIARLEDYIDLSISNSEFAKKHFRHLEFDPVERTPEWEENIYEAELEADKKLGRTPRGMGFCFAHWPELKRALAKRGIKWQTPHELNPRVMFD
ncbi:MAG: hypothetical protein J6X57_02495 [Bacteroidales bacterium]|nr:hypothetical protein [Bacteroidales bacterium]